MENAILKKKVQITKAGSLAELCMVKVLAHGKNVSIIEYDGIQKTLVNSSIILTDEVSVIDHLEVQQTKISELQQALMSAKKLIDEAYAQPHLEIGYKEILTLSQEIV